MRWETKKYPKNFLTQKKNEFKKDTIITKLLLNRNVFNKKEVDNYLYPSYKKLIDPFIFEDMLKAVKLLVSYMNSDKKILIFGDYDIDGITGSIYLSKMLEKLNIKNDIFIPEKNIFKYSLDDNFYENIKKYSLIITVDNSFGNYEEINKIKDLNIDLIITDHHFNEKEFVEIIEINPKKSLKYPFKELSGAGVVFKLIYAIYKYLNKNFSEMYEYIELISIATIADVMEATSENRFIIKRGFKNIANTKILALKKIVNNLKISAEYISMSDISYRIGPLLNAISKFDTPLKVVKLFKSDNEKEVDEIISEMYSFNKIRKNLENEISLSLINEIKNKKIKNLKYIYKEVENINLGILGSITSKLTLEFKVPVILLTKYNGYYKSSCRSINDLNIYNAILKFKNYFENYGGHNMAAGFLIKDENLEKIRKKLKNNLTKLSKNHKENILFYDSNLEIKSLNIDLLKEMKKFKPYGLKNEEPNFYSENLRTRIIEYFGENNSHFRIIKFKNYLKYEIIGYNLSHKISDKNGEIIIKNFIYTPELIDDNTVKIKIKDIK